MPLLRDDVRWVILLVALWKASERRAPCEGGGASRFEFVSSSFHSLIRGFYRPFLPTRRRNVMRFTMTYPKETEDASLWATCWDCHGCKHDVIRGKNSIVRYIKIKTTAKVIPFLRIHTHSCHLVCINALNQLYRPKYRLRLHTRACTVPVGHRIDLSFIHRLHSSHSRSTEWSWSHSCVRIKANKNVIFTDVHWSYTEESCIWTK